MYPHTHSEKFFTLIKKPVKKQESTWKQKPPNEDSLKSRKNSKNKENKSFFYGSRRRRDRSKWHILKKSAISINIGMVR